MICAIKSKRLVFVDECSTNTSLAPLYGWSRCGERVHQKAPRNWGKNLTLLASITREGGMGPCLTVEGATTKEVFESYIEQVLAPTLRDGQVVVMDNLELSHKGERVKELIEERGCELIYLPPYSPDFNPIEQAFSKIKNLLREARARVYEALVEVIGKALSAITLEDSQGFFEHCGYHVMGQPL
jgi:transposase